MVIGLKSITRLVDRPYNSLLERSDTSCLALGQDTLSTLSIVPRKWIKADSPMHGCLLISNLPPLWPGTINTTINHFDVPTTFHSTCSNYYMPKINQNIERNNMCNVKIRKVLKSRSLRLHSYSRYFGFFFFFFFFWGGEGVTEYVSIGTFILPALPT